MLVQVRLALRAAFVTLSHSWLQKGLPLVDGLDHGTELSMIS